MASQTSSPRSVTMMQQLQPTNHILPTRPRRRLARCCRPTLQRRSQSQAFPKASCRRGLAVGRRNIQIPCTVREPNSPGLPREPCCYYSHNNTVQYSASNTAQRASSAEATAADLHTGSANNDDNIALCTIRVHPGKASRCTAASAWAYTGLEVKLGFVCVRAPWSVCWSGRVCPGTVLVPWAALLEAVKAPSGITGAADLRIRGSTPFELICARGASVD